MRLTIPVVTMAILLLVQQSHSQLLGSVEWGGYIIVSDEGEEESVIFDVKELGDVDSRDYKITMIHNDQAYLFEKLEIKDDEIIFKLDTGSLYDCSLTLQDDGSFSGDCIRPNVNKNKISIRMTPDQKKESIKPNEKKLDEQVKEAQVQGSEL